jgi:two-component system, sensor histidine kinase and response regulator
MLAGDRADAEGALRRLHAGRRVLVAEDNPLNQALVNELLAIVGLTVELANDGAQAVQLALSRPYDLILMDVNMPEVDGLSATRTIRGAGQHLPIVAVSANASREGRESCLAAGMNDHLTKPVDAAVLYSTVLRWLSTGAAPEPAAPAAAGAANPLVARLAGVQGLDPSQGMDNAGGHSEIFERMMNAFVRHFSGGVPELVQPPSEHFIDSLRATCHSMRGACVTIGASRLNAELLDLERSLHAAADVQALAEKARRVQDELLRFVAQLSAALQR